MNAAQVSCKAAASQFQAQGSKPVPEVRPQQRRQEEQVEGQKSNNENSRRDLAHSELLPPILLGGTPVSKVCPQMLHSDFVGE